MGNYKGLKYKVINTIGTNFIFFHMNSWLHNRHKEYYSNKCNKQEYAPSASTRFTISSLAAIANIFLTLPFDVISTRKQTSLSSSPHQDSVTLNNEEEKKKDEK